MAAWHFEFALVPKEALLRSFPTVPRTLPEYESKVQDESFDETREFPNYWEGIDIAMRGQALFSILPEVQSWDTDARMFEDEAGNRIEIWSDDVNISLNLANYDRPMIEKLVTLVAEMDCLLVLAEDGSIHEPDFQSLSEKISNSRAARFLADPVSAIKSDRR